jgi:hypothetical protein
MNAKYLVLWNNGNTEETNILDFAKLGKLTRKDFPSHTLPKLVAYDVYQNGTVRDCQKYPHGVK